MSNKWVEPSFSRGAVDRAGRLLAEERVDTDLLAIGQALDVINNWRSSHSFPLNTLQMWLRHRSGSICPSPIVAQRLKRVPSIVQKLRRFPKMNLSRMQDIGGARAVLPNVRDVDQLRESYRHTRARHALTNEKDYVRHPKASGYRGIHLVFRYHSDKRDVYNGLQIELQLRTRTQHAWATAVETVGTFLRQSLKASQGPEDWLRFFRLIGSGFALAESTPLGDDVPDDSVALLKKIRNAAEQLQVRDTLRGFQFALRVQHEQLHGHKYVLLVLQPEEESLKITAFPDVAMATNAYLAEEKSLANTSGDVVLVSSDSLESLRRAFPNYFADTQWFVREMDRLLC